MIESFDPIQPVAFEFQQCIIYIYIYCVGKVNPKNMGNTYQ